MGYRQRGEIHRTNRRPQGHPLGSTPPAGWGSQSYGLGRGVLKVARALLLLTLLVPLPVLHAQEPAPGPEAQVEALLAAMTAEERVGQLFLVAFVGNDARSGSDIAALIRQDHVGGVVLLAANSNFTNGPDTPRQVAELANGLQALTMGTGSQVPLFVAVDHEGDGYPYTRITGGTTPLPNAMAIGATWDVDNARDVGQITGLELAAMGVNLLLGPSVDVLQNPRPSGQGDIGTRTFGGDPWWVGQMGRAYIEGVHQGSGGRVATVAKHFPGHGGSDRLPDEEVATVDKSLEDLKRVELAPFMAITDGGEDANEVTDALMSSHIRYRGVQGDMRQFTAPISFDSEGMGAILDLEEFATWRQTGLMVSDSLGVPAVRKYFDPTLNTFPHRRIAKEAFLAGNDLLLLSQFDLSNVWADQLQNIRDTIAFFRDEYEASPTFAARVDEAVTRILRLKLRLYPEFTLEAVQVHPAAALQVCGLGTEVTEGIANQALTLLYPDLNAMPPPPDQGEKLLIFTDARPVRECFTDQCPPFSPLSQTAVEEAILRAYGPEGTEQIAPEEITSLPFGQLKKFLLGEQIEYDVGTLLSEADWIIFAQQDLNPVKGPNSDTVELFLNDSRSAAYEARLVVLAFNAPYYLDTTEISKLSLYLGGYSKVDPFIETAVRTLFGEHIPRGVSPVDVVGINYDLERQLGPDATQTIPLLQLEPASTTGLQPPVRVRLQAGPIWDRNGHLVRDGTTLTVYAEYTGGAYAPPVSAYTVNGLAELSVMLNDAGQVQLRAESGEARNSQVLDLTIQPLPTATVTPSQTPAPSPTERPTPVPSPSPRPSPVPTPEGQRPPPATGASGPVDGTDLGLAAGATLVIAVGSLLLLQRKQRPPTTVVRWVLLSIIGGFFGYILYALQVIHPERWEILPDVAWLAQATMIGMVIIGAVLPLVVVVMMSRLRGHEL
jgi:beta-N-acetylhexosaminidase